MTIHELAYKIYYIQALKDDWFKAVKRMLYAARNEWEQAVLEQHSVKQNNYSLTSLLYQLCNNDPHLIDAVKGKSRKKPLVEIRSKFCYISRTIWGREVSYQRIGNKIGIGHADVIYHYRKMTRKLTKNVQLKNEIITLINNITNKNTPNSSGKVRGVPTTNQTTTTLISLISPLLLFL